MCIHNKAVYKFLYSSWSAPSDVLLRKPGCVEPHHHNPVTPNSINKSPQMVYKHPLPNNVGLASLRKIHGAVANSSSS